MFSTSATPKSRLGQAGLGEAILDHPGQLDQVLIAGEEQGRLVAPDAMRGVPAHRLDRADDRAGRPTRASRDRSGSTTVTALERRRPADVQARTEQGRAGTARTAADHPTWSGPITVIPEPR